MEVGDDLLEFALRGQDPPQIELALEGRRIGLQRLLQMRNRLIELLFHGEGQTEIGVRLRIFGPQLDSLFEMRHGLIEPPHLRQRGAQIDVRARVIGGSIAEPSRTARRLPEGGGCAPGLPRLLYASGYPGLSSRALR